LVSGLEASFAASRRVGAISSGAGSREMQIRAAAAS